MKDKVLTESYVERFAREQKEKMGIPAKAESAEMGIPSEMGIPVESVEEAEKGIPVSVGIPDAETGIPVKEGKSHGKNTRGKGQAAPTE